MTGPRILAIMGSGEMAPTMAREHVALFARFGAEPVSGAILDTTYGFQENADELSERLLEFFVERVGRPFAVASYRSRDVDAATAATAVARIRAAGYVMAGPGSPSYALRQWAGGPIPGAMSAKLAAGGVLVMASAAALTLGLVTIPIYEIYKVGEEPRWLEGLDLLGPATGLRAAVVPHFDNAEGGSHDTRFCYMGERRLRALERSLPEGAFVLGVDGHTALILDLEAGSASVTGLGGVTVRVAGASAVFPSGTQVAIAALAETAAGLAAGRSPAVPLATAPSMLDDQGTGRASSAGGGGTARDEAGQLERAFERALGTRDVPGAVTTVLELDSAIEARTRAGEDSLELDEARSILRALVARLGEAAVAGLRDPREIVSPFVETLLELRARARDAHDWAVADLVRQRLATAGVEVRDGPDGSTWQLGPQPAGTGPGPGTGPGEPG
ncbi:MAG: hypothetical protein MUC54_07725 [Chloroflexi bacterium]|nr:hypothetical protein [Chloroflexota bacterium]